jgi:hypothetical protein
MPERTAAIGSPLRMAGFPEGFPGSRGDWK